MTCTKPATSQPTLETLITRFPSVASDARLTA